MRYSWKRFWCKREGVMNLTDGGFLLDPESDYAEWYQSDVVSFEDIVGVPCLGLLGEPGIGKSTAMEDMRDAFQESVDFSAGEVLYVNLNEYGDEARLVTDVFECEKFAAWVRGNHMLHMFLDSLDECRIKVQNVGTILLNRLGRLADHLPRLRLRIACRTLDWPDVLEGGLPNLWGMDGVGVFELAPLRRQDIRTAAEAEGLDAEGLIGELNRTESVPLAITPITLSFLLSIFKDQGALPRTRSALYEQGCLRLCDERNPHRLDMRQAGGAGRLSAEQRLVIAARIAAVTVFCRRPTVYTGPAASSSSNEEVSVLSLGSGSVRLRSTDLIVSEEHVREVLGTGLFSSRGAHRMGFAHQSYAEFLASRYLASHNTPSEKVLALFQHPGDPDGRLVPQLYETASWIACYDKKVLKVIAGVDPQVLLRSDAGNLNADDRAMIVDCLLAALQSGRVNDRDLGLSRHYHKLPHPGLAAQLQPWLTDKSKHVTARDVAIGIAASCELAELQSELADIALDQGEAGRLRDSAARAIEKIGNVEVRGRLRPLVFGQAGDDPDDQLKGNGFRALWPDLITPEELFAHLTPPKRHNLYGAYVGFIEGKLLAHLNVDGLPSALEWLRRLATRRHDFHLGRLADEIIIMGWAHMDDPETFQGMVITCGDLLRQHEDLVQDHDEKNEHSVQFDDDCKRRKLAKAIVEQCADPQEVVLLMHRWPRLIRSEDFEWCAAELLSSVSGPTEPFWAHLTWTLCRWSEPDSSRLDIVVAIREESPEFRRESERFFTPVDVASEEAQRMREMHELTTEKQQEEQPEALEWLPKDRIQHCLSRFENGELAAWWALIQEMTLEDTSTHYRQPFGLDITVLPGWTNSDEQTRARILGASESYLRSCEPFDRERLFGHSASQKEDAAYKAICLLWLLRPEALAAMPESVWAHWTPILFGPFDLPGREDVKECLISMAHDHAPRQLANVVAEMARHETNNSEHILVLRDVEKIWDQHIGDAVYGLLEETEAKPSHWGQLLAALVMHRHSRAIERARSLLSLPLPQNGPTRQLVLQAAIVLIRHTADASWRVVWPAIQADREFGREVMMEVAHGTHHNVSEIACKLREQDQAALFIWLVNEFPYSEDREHDQVFSPSRDDSVRELRDGLVRLLENAGTPASCQALEQARAALPGLDWLGSVLIEARKNMLRETWQPLQPDELLEFACRPDKGLVRDASELQELLLDTLMQLEQDLQGETPAAPDLWDQVVWTRGQEKFKPKDENHFSDWVKRNLESAIDDRGVIVAREVQIRRGEGSGTGEQTDIHVTAVVPGVTEGDYEPIRVIIEAKGCWNPDLRTAMKDQLIDRYLKDSDCRHGIYLVGWYDCDQWDGEDYRRGNVPKWTLEKARIFFDGEASSLSSGDLTVKTVVMNTSLR